jgi:hypothetical protein
MKATLLMTATLASVISTVLPAQAADTQLLNLIMPDAKVLAGVNVDQAKTSAFGQYVISQINAQQNKELQDLIAATGFDPTNDVHEVLAASAGSTNEHTGLVVARGNFNAGKIIGAAMMKGDVKTETYNGVTILEDPKQLGGVAFLSPTIAAAGDLASVKGAIDRQKSTGASLPAAVTVLVSQWSTQDAWAISAVPPGSLHPNAGMPLIPGVGANGQSTALQGIQQAAGGVRFGSQVVLSGQAVAATADDAKQMGDALKLLASLAQLQSNADPNVMALAKSLQVTTDGTTLNASVSLSQDALIGIVKAGPKHTGPMHRVERAPQRKM